jgi:hypothetical protein
VQLGVQLLCNWSFSTLPVEGYFHGLFSFRAMHECCSNAVTFFRAHPAQKPLFRAPPAQKKPSNHRASERFVQFLEGARTHNAQMHERGFWLHERMHESCTNLKFMILFQPIHGDFHRAFTLG